MGERIRLRASDGHELGAYRSAPSGRPRGGVVVLQEIFGVNSHIRAVVDEPQSEKKPPGFGGFLGMVQRFSTPQPAFELFCIGFRKVNVARYAVCRVRRIGGHQPKMAVLGLKSLDDQPRERQFSCE